ncbi:MAG: sulfatase/phosphatase domain-containing protein, partial [Oscillospiraceae bacterium]
SVEGKSFIDALTGDDGSSREDLFFAYTGLIRSVKTKRFKLIEYKNARGETQLFDIQNDPHEMINLINDTAYLPVVEDLKKRMLDYKQTWENNNENVHTDTFWGDVSL